MANLAGTKTPFGPREIMRRVKALEAKLDRVASSIANVSRAAATTMAKSLQYDLNTATFTNGSWDVYAEQVVVAPQGFTKADVQLYVTAGGTFTDAGGGNISVMPVVESSAGPPVANGVPAPSACSVASVMSRHIPVVGGSVYIAAYCARNGGVVAGSNNVHMSAQIVFSR